MKKYKTYSVRSWRKPAIIPVEADRETESYVWIGGTREAKRSSDQKYHDTWDAAYEYLLKCTVKNIKSAKEDLEKSEQNLLSIKEMKNEKN